MNSKIIVGPEAQSLVLKIFNFIGLSMWTIQNIKCYICTKHTIV
jgi:hypothetical protein